MTSVNVTLVHVSTPDISSARHGISQYDIGQSLVTIVGFASIFKTEQIPFKGLNISMLLMLSEA